MKIAPHVCKCTKYEGKLYDMGMGYDIPTNLKTIFCPAAHKIKDFEENMYFFGKIPQMDPVSAANPSGNHEIQGCERQGR